MRQLTLVDMQEGFPQLARKQRLGQIPEELLDHVGHVVRRLVLVAHVIRTELTLLPQSLNPRLHTRFTEQTHLKDKQ